VPNPRIHRYAIGSSHPGLVRRADGSIVVALQRDRPAEPGVDRRPAPAGGFPAPARVLDGRWRPPPVIRVGPAMGPGGARRAH
jgi:hypothetical protein